MSVPNTPENVTPSDSPPGIESHVRQTLANNSLSANHSPEPWSIFSGQTPGILFEIRFIQPNPEFDEVVALIPSEEDEPVHSRVLANGALIAAAPRLLRALRQLFAEFIVPPEYRDTPTTVEAVKAASELLHNLQKAGVF
jgi:hypothetical protein